MESAQPQRSWTDLFPSHAAGWLIVSAIVAIALVAKPRINPQPVNSAEVVAATDEPSKLTDAERAANYAWLSRAARKKYEPLNRRLAPPDGFVPVRLAAGSFGDWLRHLPLRPAGTPVTSGSRKVIKPADSPDVAAAVDLQPGNGNLLIAANLALRLRAEYLWTSAQGANASFTFTNGQAFEWSRWCAGERPIVTGRQVEWRSTQPTDASRVTYTGYMESLFRYSSVYSLWKDTHAVTDDSIQPGDVYVVLGRPGHAVVVLDVAVDAKSHRVVALLGHGGTPAQTFHVARASSATPWFEVRAGSNLSVPPSWTLQMKHLRRW